MAIYLTLVLIVLNHVAFGGSRVVLTLFALESGATQMQVGILMALYALCPMLFAIAIGRLADRVGPRLPMLLGSVGLGIGLLLVVASPTLATLYVAALLLGSSFHFFFVTVTGVAGGIGGTQHRSRNYALVSLGFSGAGFIGPLVAGFSIDYLGHLKAFMILASCTVIPILMLWLKPGFLPGAVKTAADGTGGSALDLWRTPQLRNTFIASGFISAGWDLFNFYLPVYGHGIGLSASAIGIILGAAVAPEQRGTDPDLCDFCRCRRLYAVPAVRQRGGAVRGGLPARTRRRLRPADVNVADLHARAEGSGLGSGGHAGDGQQLHPPGDPAGLRQHRHCFRLRPGVAGQLGAARCWRLAGTPRSKSPWRAPRPGLGRNPLQRRGRAFSAG
jgi:hypothetical protein